MKESSRRNAKPNEQGPLLPHTDFDGAFTEGTVFLEGDQEYKMETEKLGTLVVPSGRIVVNDAAGGLLRATPLERTVPPGKYPVTSCWNGNATCAMKVRFSTRKAVRWEKAPGFGVDSGLAGFFDAEAARIAGNNENWHEQLNTQQHSIKIDPVSGANMVWCFPAYGDGGYACYWGLDRSDNVVSLVADFGILVEAIYKEHVITELYEKVGSELEDPWFSQFECTGVRMDWCKRKNEFRFEYRSAESLFSEVELLNGKGKRAGRGSGTGRQGFPGDPNCLHEFTQVFNVNNDKKATLRIKAFVGLRALPRKS